MDQQEEQPRGTKRSQTSLLVDSTNEALGGPHQKKRKTNISKEESIESELTKLEKDGWKLGMSPLLPRPQKTETFSTINHQKCLGFGDDYTKILFSLITPEMWDFLMKQENENLFKASSFVKPDQKRLYGSTNKEEYTKFWFTLFLMEMEVTKAGNLKDTLDHFRKNDVIPIARNRFMALLANCFLSDLGKTTKNSDSSNSAKTPENPILEFCEMLNQSFSSHYTTGGRIVLDESVYAYAPKKATKSKLAKNLTPYPGGYFPRKPHPNGLYRFNSHLFH